jgi:hypothetical protein
LDVSTLASGTDWAFPAMPGVLFILFIPFMSLLWSDGIAVAASGLAVVTGAAAGLVVLCGMAADGVGVVCAQAAVPTISDAAIRYLAFTGNLLAGESS